MLEKNVIPLSPTFIYKLFSLNKRVPHIVCKLLTSSMRELHFYFHFLNKMHGQTCLNGSHALIVDGGMVLLASKVCIHTHSHTHSHTHTHPIPSWRCTRKVLVIFKDMECLTKQQKLEMISSLFHYWNTWQKIFFSQLEWQCIIRHALGAGRRKAAFPLMHSYGCL